MERVIRDKLREISVAERVRILYAVESGSRAWGFPSPDSDYDVRFIYLRGREDYLRLEAAPDVIEWQLDETLDINGWDLQKALRLAHAANPTLLEWLSSQIIYASDDDAMKEIRPRIMECFNAKKGVFHYISMAKSNFREYLKNDVVRLKKYFYVLRPILAAKWILEKNSMPPILFSELLDAELEESLKPTVRVLLAEKMNSPELGTGKRIDQLNEYIERSLDGLEKQAEQITLPKSAGWERLNGVFLETLARQEQMR